MRLSTVSTRLFIRRNTALLILILIGASITPTYILTSSSKSKDRRVIVIFHGEVDSGEILKLGGKVIRKLSIINGASCIIPETAVKSLEKHSKVSEIRPDNEVRLIGDKLPWGVDRINAERVWGCAEDSTDVLEDAGDGICVAVIDTGVDYTHRDLADRFNPGLKGYDFVNDDPDPMDDNGHGTHCAGIIASSDNELGIIGVAPKVKLYALKVLDRYGHGYESDVVAAIEWCINHDVKIVSMSFGADVYLPSLNEACDEAYRRNILLFAAAGNDGYSDKIEDTVDYPARFESVIAVGATDLNDRRAVWGRYTASSTGPTLELVAPGDEIYSTYLGNGYATMSGTSMSCPHAAGVAALLWSINRNLTNVEVRVRLQETALDLGEPGRDWEYGYGLIDAEAAVQVSKPSGCQLVHIDYTPIDQVSGVLEPDREAYMEAGG